VRPSATSARPSIFIHHIRAVFTITDPIATPCENHSQIAEAKRVPASRDGQALFDIFDSPRWA